MKRVEIELRDSEYYKIVNGDYGSMYADFMLGIIRGQILNSIKNDVPAENKDEKEVKTSGNH